MAHVHLFCDESGKIHNSDFVSFCGYLGSNRQWEQLSSEWSALRIKRAVPPIHVSAMMRPENDELWSIVKQRWGKEYEDRRELLLDEFSCVISESKILCVGAVVDCNAFKSLSLPKVKKSSRDDPHYLAFQWTVLRSIERVEWGDSDGLLGLLLDDDHEKALHCYALLHRLKEQYPQIRKRVSGICFCNDDKYPGVQAADMIAFEARRLMVAGKTAPSQRFLLLTQNGVEQPHLFDTLALENLEREAQ